MRFAVGTFHEGGEFDGRVAGSDDSFAEGRGQAGVGADDEVKLHGRIGGAHGATRLARGFSSDGLDFRRKKFFSLGGGRRSIEDRIWQGSLISCSPSCHGEGMVPERFQHGGEVNKIICSRLWPAMIRRGHSQPYNVPFGTVRCKQFRVAPEGNLIVENGKSR